MPEIKSASLGEDGRLEVEYQEDDPADLGTTVCANHQYRVRIEGEPKELYFHSPKMASNLAQVLREEGFPAVYIETKDFENWIEIDS